LGMMKFMILGIGTDLAEVDRIQRSVERYGERFLQRVYTDLERRYSMSKKNFAERLAGRFAAKEAGMKAIGTGWRRGVTWKDFEVVNEPGGKPTLRLSGVAAQVAARMGVTSIALTITHTSAMAMAVVILEG
jgi:holo-[acyl-carrier protein] synthase